MKIFKQNINDNFFYESNMAKNNYYLMLDKKSKDVFIVSKDIPQPIFRKFRLY